MVIFGRFHGLMPLPVGLVTHDTTPSHQMLSHQTST